MSVRALQSSAAWVRVGLAAAIAALLGMASTGRGADDDKPAAKKTAAKKAPAKEAGAE